MDVIVTIGNQQWDSRKPVQYLLSVFRARKALKYFLDDETRREDRLTGFDCSNQRAHFRRG
jgi:hypothetical protein